MRKVVWVLQALTQEVTHLRMQALDVGTTSITQAWASAALIYILSSYLCPQASWLQLDRALGVAGEGGGAGAALPSPLLSLGPWEPGLRGGGGGPQTGNASLGSLLQEGRVHGGGGGQGEQGWLGGDW